MEMIIGTVIMSVVRESWKVKSEVMGIFVSLKILNPNVSFPTNLYQ